MNVEINKKLLKTYLLDLLAKDKVFKRKVAVLIKEESKEIVTKTYLDQALAKQSKYFDELFKKQSKEFDEKLAEQSRNFSERLAEQSRIFDERLAEQSRNFSEKLAEQSKIFDEKLAEQSRNFSEKLAEQSKIFSERLAEQSRIFDEKLAKQSKDFDEKLKKLSLEFDEKLNKQTAALIKIFDDRIRGLGGRWGEDAEYAFRKGLKEVVEENFNGKVSKWHYSGKVESISPKSKEYEVDVLITDNKTILLEIKGSVYEAQVERFEENASAYEEVEKKKVDRKIIITPFASARAIELAEKYKIEILSPPVNYYLKS